MPVELVGDSGVNALKRRLRMLHQEVPTNSTLIEETTRQLERLGWKVIICPRVEPGKKSRIVFEQVGSQS